ncbi:hypothetical protein LCGC14_1816640 [marine sediment metagenome]|uniref:Uncharacterized protein n=1 Tax=marine sediment metagenome TaxID=412755 RepID=A0A0F9JJQ5_9ZZZZ
MAIAAGHSVFVAWVPWEYGHDCHKVRTGSCQKRPYTAFLCHRDNRTVQGFLARALRGLSPVMVRFYSVFQAGIAGIWHGMLTGQKNYRITNAVIERFYRLGRIISIMGRVSI